MTAAARERARVRTPVLVASAIAWLLLIVNPGAAASHDHHLHHMRHNTPVDGAAAWLVMLIAMMLPLLAPSIRHVRDRSFARRRNRATCLVVASYLAVWMAAGSALMAAAFLVGTVRDESIAIAGSLVVIAAWQLSPYKQICLNRMHVHPELPAFGTAADLGVIRFGASHAGWCVGSCWGLMFLPMLCASGHLAMMALVTPWMWAEQLDRPAAPGWRLRIPLKAVRLMINRIALPDHRGSVLDASAR